MLSVFLAFSTVALCQVPTSDQLEELVAIKNSYNENRHTFDHGTFQFTYERFKDASLEDARLRKFHNSKETTGTYTFSTEGANYSRLFSDDALKSAVVEMTGNRAGSDLMSFRVVTNRVKTLEDRHAALSKTQTEHKVTIIKDLSRFHQNVVFPLEIGFSDEFRRDYTLLLERIINRSGKVQLKHITHNEPLGSRSVTKIDVQIGNASRSYYIDLERGCIPLVTEHGDENGITFTEFLDELEHVPGRGWLPLSSVYYFRGRGEHVHVTTFDFAEPGRAMLRLDFEKPLPAFDMAEKVMYKPQMSWDLSVLPSRSPSNSVAFATAPVPIDPPMPGEVNDSRWSRYVLGTAAALFVIGLVILRQRKQRNK